MKKRGTRGKKYSIDSHGQGRMYFFWKHRHHLVSPSSFLKRMEKQYFDVSCPKFSIPLSYSTRLSMHLFFVSHFFVATNYIYIYIVCAWREKKKKINNYSRMKHEWKISPLILINRKIKKTMKATLAKFLTIRRNKKLSIPNRIFNVPPFLYDDKIDKNTIHIQFRQIFNFLTIRWETKIVQRLSIWKPESYRNFQRLFPSKKSNVYVNKLLIFIIFNSSKTKRRKRFAPNFQLDSIFGGKKIRIEIKIPIKISKIFNVSRW